MNHRSDWVAFWDSDHSIYVNARHRDAHFRGIAEDIAAYVPSPNAAVLDYGCGKALHAERLAQAAGRLILIDAAPKVRAELATRYKDHGTIEIRAPQDLETMSDHSIDLVVVNSVTQYLAPAELEGLLKIFRRLLTPGGLLLIGDVVPPHASAVSDALALLRFGGRHGFFFAAIGGLLRTALSDYRRLRSAVGLTSYSEAGFLARLEAAGFSATRAPANIGHNQGRMTFRARPALTPLNQASVREG